VVATNGAGIKGVLCRRGVVDIIRSPGTVGIGFPSLFAPGGKVPFTELVVPARRVGAEEGGGLAGVGVVAAL
jgi:hypothetical protein